MSAAASGGGPTTKATTTDPTPSSTLKDQQKPAAALEEDDEFEDFPIDGRCLRLSLNLDYRQAREMLMQSRADWAPEESEVPPGSEGGTTHLWEESWDDDDTSEDFSKQLKWAPSMVNSFLAIIR